MPRYLSLQLVARDNLQFTLRDKIFTMNSSEAAEVCWWSARVKAIRDACNVAKVVWAIPPKHLHFNQYSVVLAFS